MAELIGEAAIRIIPTLKGFKPQADALLRNEKLDPVKVRIEANTKEASAKLDEWREKERLRGVSIPVKANTNDFDRKLTQVEHRLKSSALHDLAKINIKVLGLEALPLLGYAAASAASGLDALGASALALPGILAGVGASVGTLALGLSGLKKAFGDFDSSMRTTAQRAHQIADDNRQLERSYRDYKTAVRETTREIQDLNAENRRSSLNIADAQLSIQEAADRLRQGNFSTVTELRRAQLEYAQSIDHYNEVLTKANRTQEDANRMNAQGVQGSDRVVTALDAINKGVEKLNNDRLGKFGMDLARLSPNAQAAGHAVEGLYDAWHKLSLGVEDHMLAGMDKEITQLARVGLPTLSAGMTRVADGFNKDFHAIFQALGAGENQSLIRRVFGNDAGMLDNLSRGIKPLVDGVLHMVAGSSDFLPRLGNAADAVFTRFDNWTKKISEDGSLKQWIDRGLHAMDDLGHIGTGVLGVIHKIADAFNAVSGHQGGFLKTLDDELAKINAHLSSPEGMAKLEGYLRGAKNEFNELKGAWHDMKPTVETLVGYTREWGADSAQLLGTVLKIVAAFDRWSGAVGPILQLFLAMRTVKMVGSGLQDLYALAGAPTRGVNNVMSWWDKLGSGSATAVGAAKEVQKATDLATASTMNLGKAVSETNKRADDASVKAMRMTRDVENFVSPARTAADAEGALGSNAERAGNLMTTAGNGAVVAGQQIGTAGSRLEEAGEKARGMGTKIGALGSALGAGALNIGLTLAITVAITALDKLGEAHRRAAQRASEQQQQLASLADSMDRVTGAAGKSAQAQADAQARKFTFGTGPDRNLYDDSNKAGIGNQQQLFNAFLPQNQPLRDDLLHKADEINEKKIGTSDFWKRWGSDLQDAGVNIDVFAKAAGGDPDSLNKVRDAYGKIKNKLSQDTTPGADHTGPDDLGKVTSSLGVESFSTAAGLRMISGSMVAGGAAAQQTNQVINGQGRFKPGMGSFWAGFGGLNDDAHISINPDGTTANIITDREPTNITPDIGSTTKNADGQWVTALTPDATKAYLNVGHFADGGLVRGAGTTTSDSIWAKLSDWEHVTKASSVKYYGEDTFNKLNNRQIPRSVVHNWMSGAMHRKTGGFGGGFKMDGPTPPPIIPAPAPAPAPAPGPGPVPPPIHPDAPAGPAAPGATPWIAPPTQYPTNVPDPLNGWSPGQPYPGFSAVPGSGPGYPADATPGVGGPISLPGISMGGNGALPEIKGNGHDTAASTAPNAPIIPQANILQYLQQVAKGAGLWAGSGPGSDGPGDAGAQLAASLGIPTHSNDGALHSVDRAMDIGNLDQANSGQISAFVKSWMADPVKVAATRQLIFRGPDGDYGIINGRILTGPELQQVYGKDLPDHNNHVHLGLEGVPLDAIPGGAGAMQGLGGMPGLAGVPGDLTDPSSMAGQSPMGMLQWRLQKLFNPQNMLNNIEAHYAQAYSPKSMLDFFSSQGQLAGQDMLGIFSGLLQGFTGINISSVMGPLDQVGNYGLSMISPTGSGVPGMTDLNSGAGGNISNFLGGGLPNLQGLPGYGTSATTTGATTGTSGTPGAIGGGGEAYRPLIRQVLQTWGPRFGIDPRVYNVWEDDLVKQINTESGGSTTIPSPQGDIGLLQFKPATFEQFNMIPGGQITDPYAQLVAALHRLTAGGANAYSIMSDGTPQAIGQGHGWKTGGFPGEGNAWLSDHEFKTGEAAVKYYGPGLYSMLNAGALPKFAGGGFGAAVPPTTPVVPPSTTAINPSSFNIPNINNLDPSVANDAATQGLGAIAGAVSGASSGSSASYQSPGDVQKKRPAPTAPKSPSGGATAPAPSVGSSRIGKGGSIVSGTGSAIADHRGDIASIGAAPKTLDHLNPAISQAVNGAAQTAAAWGSTAAQLGGMALNGIAPGGGSAAGSAASSLIQGAAMMGAQAVTGGLNIVASLMTDNKGPANGTPLLPNRKEATLTAPVAQKIHNGDINVTNLDEYQRAQERMDAQTAMPFVGKYW